MTHKACLAIKDDQAERFGTVSHHEGEWAIVIPFNDKMRDRALALGKDRCYVVYR